MKFRFRLVEQTLNEITDNVKEVDSAYIDEVTLLSIKEARKLPKSIRDCGYAWWLRDPGYYSSYYAAYVTDWGLVNDRGDIVDVTNGVRPAIILDLSSPSLESLFKGDIIEVFGRKWYYNGDGKALLMGEPLTKMPFKYGWDRKEGNDYEKSDVKEYLGNWWYDQLKKS